MREITISNIEDNQILTDITKKSTIYLFYLNTYIGGGLGKLLMNNFLNRINKTEKEKVILESEPNVEKFYENFGFRKMEQIETSIKKQIFTNIFYQTIST